MEIVVTGRHTQVKQRFRDVVETKMNRVTAIAPDAQRAQIVLTHEGNPRQADTAKRVEITVIAGRIDGLDDGAPVHPQLDEALGLQSLECFPHRRAADAQPLGSLGQAQFIAALVLAGKERFSQDGGDLYPNRHGFF